VFFGVGKLQLKYGGRVYHNMHFINTEGSVFESSHLNVDLIFGDLVTACAYTELSTTKV
jgi:hypothetical protein